MNKNKGYTFRQLQQYGSIWWVFSWLFFLSVLLWGERLGFSIKELAGFGMWIVLFGRLLMSLMSQSQCRNSTLRNEQNGSVEQATKESIGVNPANKN